MTNTTPVLRATAVRKTFGRQTVLQDLSLDVVRGSVTALLGVNGAGKSTLMRLALGTLRPDRGSLEVLGYDPIRQPRTILSRVGYVPPVPDVYDWMRPRDLFRFLRPQYPTWDDALCQELVETLGVPRNTKFANMSRGEGMKTMLTAALAHLPELLLLDEPFSGLDPIVRDEILAGVVTNLREQECAVLCATHDLEFAARIADRVAILADGRIIQHTVIEDFVGRREERLSLPAALKQALVTPMELLA